MSINRAGSLVTGRDIQDRLLLLIPTTSYRVADFLDAAHRLGVDVAVGSNQRQILEGFADGRTVSIDFLDLEKGVREICAYARNYPLSAVLGVDEGTTVLASMASKALGLAHNAPESVEAAANKFRFRTVLANSGLLTPPFSLLTVDADPARAARDAAYPCVLKPLVLSASRGVIRADNPDEFITAFRRITRILEQPDVATLGDAAKNILVEGYVPGWEVALEGILDGGRLTVLALFDKPDPLDGPFFEETIYVTPSRLSETWQSRVRDATVQAVAALGLEDGPIHAELRLNDRGPWVIEVGARSIGGLCARTLRFGAGIGLEELILSHVLGLPIKTMAREDRAAGVMMIPIPRAGMLESVLGLEAARAVAGVDDVTITIPEGQEVVPLPEGNKYLGFIFARGDSPEAVEEILRDSHRRLRFRIDPGAEAE
jgi:formate-dependent phosphoribosylglycinamide formyltransferase (GAR transformylase)